MKRPKRRLPAGKLLPGHTLETRRALLEAYYAKRAHEIFRSASRESPCSSNHAAPARSDSSSAPCAAAGQLHARRNLVLNRDLVQVSPRLIDYVIAHELAHAVFPDHGAKWRTLMSRVMSDWRERKHALERALL